MNDRVRPAGSSDEGGFRRWVKVAGIVALLLALLVVVVMLVGGGGEHGPGRHLGAGASVSPASAQQVHQRPAGTHQSPAGDHR